MYKEYEKDFNDYIDYDTPTSRQIATIQALFEGLGKEKPPAERLRMYLTREGANGTIDSLRWEKDRRMNYLLKKSRTQRKARANFLDLVDDLPNPEFLVEVSAQIDLTMLPELRGIVSGAI